MFKQSKRGCVAAQQKMDYCIAAGMQFAAGDQCQVCAGLFCQPDGPNGAFEGFFSAVACRSVWMGVGGATAPP